MDFISITQYFLYGSMIIAFIYAIINWHILKNTPEKWLVVFLSITVVIEIFANYFKRVEESSLLIFSNLVIILTNIVLFIWFYENIKNNKLLITSISIGLLSFLINMLYQNFLFEIFYYSNFIISIIILINVFVYLQQLLNNSEVINFKRMPAFWVSIAVIIYQLNLVVIFFLIQELITIHKNIFYSIITISSLVLYGSMIYGIKLRKLNG